MIGVGLVAFITILAASTTASINAAIDRGFAGDIVIDSGGGLSGGVSPALAQRHDGLPQVGRGQMRRGLAEVSATREMPAVDPATVFKIIEVGHPRVDRRPRRHRHRRLQGRRQGKH